MSDSVSKYYDMQSDLNCRVGKQYPALVLDGDNDVKEIELNE